MPASEASFPHFVFVKIQRSRVYAITQSCWFRPIFENMAQMRSAVLADDLFPLHAVRVISSALDAVSFETGKARPARAGVELVFGIK